MAVARKEERARNPAIPALPWQSSRELALGVDDDNRGARVAEVRRYLTIKEDEWALVIEGRATRVPVELERDGRCE